MLPVWLMLHLATLELNHVEFFVFSFPNSYLGIRCWFMLSGGCHVALSRSGNTVGTHVLEILLECKDLLMITKLVSIGYALWSHLRFINHHVLIVLVHCLVHTEEKRSCSILLPSCTRAPGKPLPIL